MTYGDPDVSAHRYAEAAREREELASARADAALWKAKAEELANQIAPGLERSIELEQRIKMLERALAVLTKEKCPACPGNHNDSCWLGTIIRGEPGPAYYAACAAIAEDANDPPAP